jgi:mono/diheme cytochrome c family protein
MWLLHLMFCGAALATIFIIPQANDKTDKKNEANGVNTTSGKETFVEYCASCHGLDGKGRGPVASALKSPPTDLTTLAKNNEGKYPAGFVSAVLKFGRNLSAHGSQDMPVWGSRFKMIDPVNDPTGQRHVDDIVAYIATLQISNASKSN